MCKVHREEPVGGILIFVTGQDEVKRLVSKLGKTFPENVKTSSEIDLDAIEPKLTTSKNSTDNKQIETYHDDGDDDEFGEVDFNEEGDDDKGDDILKSSIDSTIPMKEELQIKFLFENES